MSELPPGFELDHTEAALPPGFVLDGGSSSPGIGEDLLGVAKTAPQRIVAGLAGIPADLAHLYASNQSDPNPLGSSALSSKMGVYDAKTPEGKFAQKIVDFAPAMIGGPETLATKALTRVLAPALASEAGGAVGGPIGEVAGALAGGVGATVAARKFQAMAAARNAASVTPSAEDLLKTAGNQFESVKASDAVIKPASVEQMAKDIKTELLNDGKHPTLGNQNGVFSALDRMETMGQQAGGVTPKDMETIRKNLVTAKMDMDGGTRAAAKQASDAFMQKYSALGQGDLLNGSNPFPILKDAIGNYAAGKRSNTVMGKVALGNLNAETAGSGANVDNALRQSIKQLVRPINNDIVPKAQRLGFNQAEIAAMNTAARGTMVGNAARYLGKAAPTGVVSAFMSGGAGHLAGGPLGAVALPAAGYIAKKIGDLSTKRAVAAIDSLVRSRSPLAVQVASKLAPQITAQLPAKSQRILQTLASQKPPVGPIVQGPQVTQPPPVVTPQTAAAPARSPVIFPQQQAPIFATPKIVPPIAPSLPTMPSAPVTAAEDGQRSRPSRVGLGENIRLGKYQDWTDGRIVKVGFVDGLKVHGVVPAIYNGDAPGFILTKGNNVYRVTPHRGMEKLSSADGEQALKDAKKQR